MKDQTKNQEKANKVWAKIVAKAWEDELFKQRLLKYPNEVLKEYGLSAPVAAAFKIHEETAKTEYLILPREPKKELSAQEMQKIAAASSVGMLQLFQSK